MTNQARSAIVLPFPPPKSYEQRYQDSRNKVLAGGDYGEHLDEIILITIDKMVAAGELQKRGKS